MNTFIKTLFLFWIFWIVLATALGWSGIFFGRIFWIVLGTGIFWILWHFSGRMSLKNIRWNIFSISSWIFIVFFILSNIFFLQYQTLFTGRDQGSIVQASFFLAKQHGFDFTLSEARPFFELYGEGKALHFPGFYYTENGNLTPQFPHPTIAWYGSLLALGIPSPHHITLGNALTLFLFALAFSSILKTFTNTRIAFLFTLIILFSFPLWWFARFSLSENVMLALLWIVLFFFLQFLKRPNSSTFLPLLLSASLLLITRIEGIVFGAILLAITLIYKSTRFYLFQKPFPILWTAFPFSLLFLSFFLNQPFYTTITKALLQTFGFLKSVQTETFVASYTLVDLWGLFLLYGLAPVFFLALVGILFLVKKIRSGYPFENKYFFLSFVILLLPSLLYFFFPFISPDHPWMFRRFMFSAIPLLLFIIAYSTFVLSLHAPLKKSSFVLFSVLSIILVSQLPPFFHFFSLKQERDLFEQTRILAQTLKAEGFSQEDVLLVERNVSGSGFSMITGVLRMEGIRSVYFFNPEDFATIEYSLFGENSDVYFLVHEKEISRYSETVDKANGQEILFNTKRLQDTSSDTSFSFPRIEAIQITNYLFQIY
jgi:hypothetical protein